MLGSAGRGATWSEPIDIGREADADLDAETDVIALEDGSVHAALRRISPEWPG